MNKIAYDEKYNGHRFKATYLKMPDYILSNS